MLSCGSRGLISSKLSFGLNPFKTMPLLSISLSSMSMDNQSIFDKILHVQLIYYTIHLITSN
jgi:hypothetical protein